LLPFCVTFPHHCGKPLPTACHRLAVASSRHSSIPRTCLISVTLQFLCPRSHRRSPLPSPSPMHRAPTNCPLLVRVIPFTCSRRSAPPTCSSCSCRSCAAGEQSLGDFFLFEPLVHLNAERCHQAELCSSEDPFPSFPSSFWCSDATTVFPSPFFVADLGFKPPLSHRAPRHTRWTRSSVVTMRCRTLALWASQARPGLPRQLWPWAAVRPREQCVFPISFGILKQKFNSILI
jgi:hypothetical protein